MKLNEIVNSEGKKIILKNPIEIRVGKHHRHGFFAESDQICIIGMPNSVEGTEEDAIQDFCDDFHWVYQNQEHLDDLMVDDPDKVKKFLEEEIVKYEDNS